MVNAPKNPVLVETLHDSAFRNTSLNLDKQPFVRLDNNTLFPSRIDPEAYADDYAGYWKIHLNLLWTITSVCLLYLSLKLLGA